jgi:hypothetical protein
VTIEDGQARGGSGGGGILNVSNTLTLTNDIFANNEALGDPGNSSFGGGAITSRSFASLAISNCSFTANQAIGGTGGFGEGGAIWNLASATFTSANASGNTASTSNDDVFGIFTMC